MKFKLNILLIFLLLVCSFANAEAIKDGTAGGGGGTSVHNNLSGLNDGDYQHLTVAEKAALVDAADISDAVAAHAILNDTHGCDVIASQTYVDDAVAGVTIPDHNDLSGLNVGDYQHLTVAEKAIAMVVNYDALYNTFVGDNVLSVITTATQNVLMGYNALSSLTSGSYNTAIGAAAIASLTTSDYNTALGWFAGFGNNLGHSNSITDTNMTFVGANTSRDNVTANTTPFTNSTALGYDAKISKSNQMVFGDGNITENKFTGSILLDSVAMPTVIDIDDAVAIHAERNDTHGCDVIASQTYVDDAIAAIPVVDLFDDAGNTFVGKDTMEAVTTAYDNTIMGYKALEALSTGNKNIAIGREALKATTYGYQNIAIGQTTLLQSLGSNGCIAIGHEAAKLGTGGTSNIAIGKNAGKNSGSKNIAIGTSCLDDVTSGGDNIAMGNSSLGKLTTGINNTGLAPYSLNQVTSGSHNCGIGYFSLGKLTTTDYNTAIGDFAGYGDTVGYSTSKTDTYMTFLGAMASRDSSIANTTVFTNSTALGYDARVSKSNQMVFGDGNITENKFTGTILLNGSAIGTGGGVDTATITTAIEANATDIITNADALTAHAERNDTHGCDIIASQTYVDDAVAGITIPDHNDLSGLNVGDYQHLTVAEKAALVDAADIADAVAIHAERNDTHGCDVIASQTYVDNAISGITIPDHNDLSGLNVGDYQHLTVAEKAALVDASDIADAVAIHAERNDTHGCDIIASQTYVDDAVAGVTIPDHNDLSGLNVGDYQHLTVAEKAALVDAADIADAVAIHAERNDTHGCDVIASQTYVDDADALDLKIATFEYYVGATTDVTFTDVSATEITINTFDVNLRDNADGSGYPVSYTIPSTSLTVVVNAINFITADYNSGSPIVKASTNNADVNESDVTPVIFLFVASDGTKHSAVLGEFGNGLTNKIHERMLRTNKYQRESGLAVTMANAGINLTFDISSGYVWFGATRHALEAVDSTVDSVNCTAPDGTLTACTEMNNTQYYNGSTLTNLSNNRYAVNWIYRGIEDDKEAYIMLGEGDYDLSSAELSSPPATPAIITSHCMLVAKVIVQRNSNTVTSNQSAFKQIFGMSTAQTHNDLSGLNDGDYQHLTIAEKAALVDATDISDAIAIHAERNDTHGCDVIASQTYVDDAVAAININDIADIVITTPDDKQVLTYDSASGDWINAVSNFDTATITAAIEINTASITQNIADISDNTNDIALNTASISVNISDISDVTDDTALNTASITAIISDIGDISTALDGILNP